MVAWLDVNTVRDAGVPIRFTEDLSVGDIHDQVFFFEEINGASGKVKIRSRHNDLCLDTRDHGAGVGLGVIAKPCQAVISEETTYEVIANLDGSIMLQSEFNGNRFKVLATSSGSSPLDSVSSTLAVTSHNGDNFDRASRPVRLSPGGGGGLCLKSHTSDSADPNECNSQSVTLSQCDPDDEGQKFTYLFGAKRWVQQRKVRPISKPT